MRVLLGITNINGFHEIPYSFGLASIASFAMDRGHEIQIRGIQTLQEKEAFFSEISKFSPRVIGFSMVSSQFEYVNRIVMEIKRFFPQVIVVGGGVHPTLYPDSIKSCPGFDGYFIGESELAFAEFLDRIESCANYHSVPNFAYIQNNELVRNPMFPLLENLDCLPHPLKDDLFIEFIKKNGYAPFFFSRGCPYNCSYCSNHGLARVYGRKANFPRYKSVSRCFDEIRKAYSFYPFSSIWILDDTFGINRQWRKEFCARYKEEIGIRFICLLRVNLVDEELVHDIKKAGCYRVLFGIESGNDHIRRNVMNRKITKKQILQASHLLRKYGLETCALNIIGVPGETQMTIKQTIRLNRRARLTDSGVSIFFPYKGTMLGDRCFSEGLVRENLLKDFTNERRESVLCFPPAFQKKLQYYQKNWEKLVFPRNLKKAFLRLIKKNELLYDALRRLKKLLHFSVQG